MLSLSCTSPWPKGSVGQEEVVVTATAQAENWNRVINNNKICCSSINLDDSLTSLQWLQEFPILGASVPPQSGQQSDLFGQQLGSAAPTSPLTWDPATISKPLTPGKPTVALHSGMQSLPTIGAPNHSPDEVDYKTNAHVRPPYSYPTLICMAMQASEKTKITLSCIYQWITDNFCYYRHADPNWQNTIRHNLSLNKYFIKVPRRKDEPGRGGFWKINPQYADRLLSGVYKKRRMPPAQIDPAYQNRLRINLQPQPRGACNPLGGLCPESPLFKEFEEATGDAKNCNPHPADCGMLGSLPAVRKRGGYKRKQPVGTRYVASKATQCSSSPLFPVDEQQGTGPLQEDFDWDSLLDSALSSELNMEGGKPLNPILKEDGLAIQGTYITPGQDPVGTAGGSPSLMETQISSDMSPIYEETMFPTAIMDRPWPVEEEQTHGDILRSAFVNLDQLFDFREPLPSIWIDTLF